MNTGTARLSAAAASLLFATIAHAQEAAHAAEPVSAMPNVKQGLFTAVTALVVFAIVFAVLATKVWPVITKGLDERAAKIKEEIEAAEFARHQAKDALEQYQKSLADARAEAQKMIDAARQQQQQIAAQLRAQADVELNAMREKARKDIEAAKRAAVAEIYTHAAGLGTMIAGKVLKRHITDADTQGLVDESLKQLQTARA